MEVDDDPRFCLGEELHLKELEEQLTIPSFVSVYYPVFSNAFSAGGHPQLLHLRSRGYSRHSTPNEVEYHIFGLYNPPLHSPRIT
jgi:hypothetical protein